MTDRPAGPSDVLEQPLVRSVGVPVSGAPGWSGSAMLDGLTRPGISYGNDLSTTVVGADGSFCSLNSVNAVLPADEPSRPWR